MSCKIKMDAAIWWHMLAFVKWISQVEPPYMHYNVNLISPIVAVASRRRDALRVFLA